MKSNAFWIRRFAIVAVAMFTILIIAAVLRDRALMPYGPEALFWSLLSAGIFTFIQRRNMQKGADCALCEDAGAK